MNTNRPATRQQKREKITERKQSSKEVTCGKSTSNGSANSSYISVIYHEANETITDGTDKRELPSIIEDLRNKLAVADNTNVELKDINEKQAIKIEYMENKLANYKMITEKQNGIIEALKKQAMLITSETQTGDEYTTSEKGIQTDYDDEIQQSQLKGNTQEKYVQLGDEAQQITTEKSATEEGRTTSTTHALQKQGEVNNEKTREEHCKKQKILILADNQGHGCSELVGDIFGDSYDVLCVFKPHTLLEDVICNIKDLTRDFGKRDYVIVIGGMNNILRSVSLNCLSFLNCVENIMHTNVIFFSVPYAQKDNFLNEKIYSFNCNIFNYISSYCKDNITYVDVDSVFGGERLTKGKYLSKIQKRKLFIYLREYVIKKKYMIDSHIGFGNIIEIIPSDENISFLEK